MRRFLLLLLVVSGCHREDVAAIDAGATAAPLASPLRAFAESADIAAVTRSAIAFDAGLRVPARSSTALEVAAPATADASLSVSVGAGEVFAASLRPIGARAVPCGRTSDARTVVCNEAYRGVDLAMVADETRVETFAVLRDASALESGRARLAFSLSTSEGLFAQQEGARVVVRDREHNTRFTIPAPYAVDGKGLRRDVTMRFTESRLELELDPQGLTYPIAIDPGLEASTWSDKIPSATPTALRYVDGFYDTVRKKTVFFGGYGASSGVNTTYTWDGATLTPGNPLPRVGMNAATVFASKRGVGWMFGGQSGLWPYDDLFEYDGTSWSTVTPTKRPPARAGAGVAYDSKRDVIVLFGGVYNYGSIWNLLGDTWEHASGGFSDKAPTTKPAGRFATQMGYDPKRDVVVMYGGQTGTEHAVTSPLGDTWEWTGTDWKPITPMASPPATAGGALLWDDVAERLVLVGGHTVDNYAYDGRTWTKLATTGFTRRLQGAFVYDSTRKTMIAYGGMTSTSGLWGMSTWTQPGTMYSSIVEWQPTPCTSSSMCGAGGTCLAGHCCATACSGSCQTCAPDGVCNTMTVGATPSDPTCLVKCSGSNACVGSCASDTDCVAGARCVSGTCVKYKPLGSVCTTGAECVGGTCVDGFCCDRPCGGGCEACDVSGKLGTCTTLAKDATPHGTRTCAGTGICAGACDGVSNVCTFVGSTQVCALASCTGTTLSQAGACDGAGSCARPASVDCAPYLCTGTACTSACATSADCAATGYCALSVCLAKKAELGSCTADEQCLSGTCVSGACAAVVDAGPDTIMPDTVMPDTAVTDTGVVEDAVATTPAPPFSTAKVPSDFTRCTKSSECTTGFCVDGVCCNTACVATCHSCALLTSPGVCIEEPEGVDLRNECGPANTCLGTCGKGAKCIGSGAGTMCAANRCTSASTGVGPAYCPGPGANCPTDTTTTFDCSPYTCEPAFGACRGMCSTSNDCANGFVCEIATKTCVVPPPFATEDGGCAMGHTGGASVACTLGLAALLATRRRRAARTASTGQR